VTANKKKLAILVGGGPAPGINSVISAATICAELDGVEVIGIRDGFKWIMQGDIGHLTPLTIETVSRIHFRGGSFIGIARDNPSRDPKNLAHTVTSLLQMDVDKLIVIGGDDTCSSAMKVEQEGGGRIRVVHVPKTIDNDIDLPQGIYTFGYQTARHIGVEIIKNLMVDAQTTHHWYFVVSMGRDAGHLALGIGKAAGATLTIISEEFPEPKIRLKSIVDILVGSIIKRLSYGRTDGVAVLAEGLLEHIDVQDLDALANLERDAYGHVRLSEVNLAEILKTHVLERLALLGIKGTIVDKNIGYELRCADPIPLDLEYTRDLGYCAARHILDGGNADIIAIREGQFVPIPFKDVLNPATGRMKARMVNVNSESYQIARLYMIRLTKADLDDPHELAKLAATANLSVDQFRNDYYGVVENDILNRLGKPVLPHIPTNHSGA
jgi:6-phosphofructokinase 1